MLRTSWSLFLVAHAALSQLTAQTFQPLPAHASFAEGQHSLPLPFGVPGFRTQILVDGSGIAPTGAVLNSISFRTDRYVAPILGSLVPNVTVRLSHTSTTPGAMSETFASNITGTVTTAFQGTVSLPAQAIGFAGPTPWNVVIQLAQPYVFTSSQGNLLIDIVGNNVPGGTPTWFLDAVQAGGSSTPFGFSDALPFIETPVLMVTTGNDLVPRLISPGHTVDFSTKLFLTTPPGMLALGTAAQPTPIDLTPLGAPANFLYIDPIVFVPHNWAQSFIGFVSRFSLTLPNSPGLIGTTLYGQSVLLVPTANPLGLILSHAAEVRIGDEFELLPLRQVDSFDPGSATGTLVDFGVPTQPEPGAVAIRLEGVFF